MQKHLLSILSVLLISFSSFAQSIDSLKLTDSEIPSGYSPSEKMLCATPHASSFYEQSDLFSSMIGNLKKKEFQSFKKKGDTGSILYFEFEKDFEAQKFLEGLLWGYGTKPTKSEPDEYYAKKNILIIWSFNLKSPLKEASKAKTMRLINNL